MHNLGTPSYAGLNEQEGACSLGPRPVGAGVGGWGGFKQENMACQKSSVLLFTVERRGVPVVSLWVPPPPPSPTSVNLHHFAALFAFDVTAPVELTAAPVHHLHLLRLEATAAAHQLAAIDGF